jgi:HD-GYP domain-containing protein (c-di-GMP phosphodiesterase class II)
VSDHDPLLDEEAARHEFGLELVTRLHGLLRAGRLYDRNNRSFQQHVEEFIATLARSNGEEVTLVCLGDYFYVDGVRLRARPGQLGLFRALRDEFESHGLGALRLIPGLGEEELAAFLTIHGAARTPEKIERIPDDLAESGVSHIVAIRERDVRSVAPESSDVSEAETTDERVRARQTFGRAVKGARGLLTRAAQTGRPAIRQARRLVQPVVDSILNDEYSIVGLTAIKDHDEYTFVHCVNVSVLSVAIGAALRLPRAMLANIGVAALLHDLGKLAVPPEVLHKPDRLTPVEWRQIERHPLEGVKMMINMPGLSPLLLDSMQVCIEHHMNVDGSGYPRGEHSMGPLSRIVAVADVFDALTAHRAYRARPFTGYEALAIMLGPELHHSDPAALWAMVQSVGLYPAGTVMRMRSGHVVVSISPNTEDPRRPYCRVVAAPGQTEWNPASDHRWDPMPEGEHVERVLPPEEHKLPIDEMLAA